MSWLQLLSAIPVLSVVALMLKFYWRPILTFSLDKPQCEESDLLENGHPATYIRAAISNIGSSVATVSVFLDEICFNGGDGEEKIEIPRSPLEWTNTGTFERKKLYGKAQYLYVDVCSANVFHHLLRPRSEKGVRGSQGRDSTFHKPGIYMFRVVAEAEERFCKRAEVEVTVLFGGRLDVLRILRPPTTPATSKRVR
jgi:hypothetical protein